MADKLLEMLRKNLFEELKTSFISQEFKSGTCVMEIDGCNNELRSVRYKYLLNLCSEKGRPFAIPPYLDPLERCCMMFSFGDYSLLDKNVFDHDFLGAKDEKTDDFCLYVYVKYNGNRKSYPFSARGIVYKDVLVQPLTVREQIILCLYMIKTYKQTKCKLLRQSKVQAYIDRINFSKNDTNFFISRITAYYNSLISMEFSDLERYKYKEFYIDPEFIYSFPLVLNCDIDIQLANCYQAHGLIEKARSIYAFYLFYGEEINCLIKLGDKEQAVMKIQNELIYNVNKNNFYSKILKSDYNIKLASLLDNLEYYDRAFECFKSFEPLYAKGIHCFKRKMFDKAVDSFQAALKIAPENEKILFSYACTLKEVGSYKKSIDVFERLIEKDNKRLEYYKNLALCYLYLNDLENAMDRLRVSVNLDVECLELFFQLALANKRKEDLLWSFTKLNMSKSTKDKIKIVLERNLVDTKELESCIYTNPKLRPYLKDLFN